MGVLLFLSSAAKNNGKDLLVAVLVVAGVRGEKNGKYLLVVVGVRGEKADATCINTTSASGKEVTVSLECSCLPILEVLLGS